VGATIRPATLAGLDRSSSDTAAAVGRPACAICWYIAQMLGRNRPHSTCWRTAVTGAPRAGSGVPNPAEPWVNSSPAHCLANTPPAGPPPAAFGNSAVARLFQALCATTASIRWS